MNDFVETNLCAYVSSVLRLLLPCAQIEPGLIITAGGELDCGELAAIADQAAVAGTDMLHLQVADTATDLGSLAITLIMPRDPVCFVQTRCRLWIPREGEAALIVPPPGSHGYFKLVPDEIIHLDGWPAANMDDGFDRAAEWLRRCPRPSASLRPSTNFYAAPNAL